MIEPEAVPPAPRTSRHRRAVVAGVTLLALVAGGIAVALDGGGPEAKPLALLAGNGAAGKAESMAARTGAPAPFAPALGAAADSRSAIYPYGGGWGLKFEVEGQLPALADHAAAWRVNGPNLDRAALVRIAGALGVTGTPVQRDGGWFVDGGDWTLSAFGGDAMGKGGNWYLNLYRSRYDGRPDDAAADETPTGPAISRADAERRVQELLDHMGAPKASWRVETTETEIGTGWACAPSVSPEDLKKLEAEKLSQLERENQGSANSSGAATPKSAPAPDRPTTAVDPAPPAASGSGSSAGSPGSVGGTTPGAKPAPGIATSCPPPPAPVKGFNVALYPVLDGRRADWPVWNVTMRSDGRIENLSGSWVTFERGGDYKLRGVEAALKELQSPPVAYAVDTPAAIEPTIAVDPATAFPGAGTAAPSRLPLRDDVSSSPAVDLPADAPVCPPMPMPIPMPAQDDKATSPIRATCAPPVPQVVKIAGVELGLIQTSVFEKGQVRLALVPSYRFIGHFVDGTPWETSVVALHPDAIAPPPDYPVSDVGGGTTGVGKAVPPTPAPEPAIARDSSR